MHKPGIYQIHLFNELGSKKKTKESKTYINAQKKSCKFLNKHPTCSTVIARVMFNSRKVNDPWGYDSD